MSEYICPGCLANDVAEDCYHSEVSWLLAEAMRDGVEQLHPSTNDQGWEHGSITGAWYFVDGAMDVISDVGEPPYSITWTHPGGRYATLGLVNGRHLIGIEEGEGEAPTDYLGTIEPLLETVPLRTDTGKATQ